VGETACSVGSVLRASQAVPWALCAAAALLVAAVPAKGAYPPSAEGYQLAVVTDHAEATRAALDTLRAGGNAVDGAITAALTLGVVAPTASGMGGGGFALVYVAKERRVVALDFRETAPEAVSRDGLKDRESREDAARRGVAVGVPGEPAGLEWLSQRYGRRSLAQDAAPAAQVAANGFPLSQYQASVLQHAQRDLLVSPELTAMFLPGGAPLPFRSLVRRPDLAHTITKFGAQGSRAFYEGSVGAKILRAVHAAGGTLEMNDLASYRVKERAPLSRTIDGRTVVTFPAPSAGGLMLVELLSMYGANAQSPLAAMGFESSAYLHTLGEAMRGAVADRARLLGDPDADPDINAAVERALDPAQLAARRARIEPNRTHAATEFRTREQGTSHLIVSDAEGNVVSLTTTINDAFGARLVAGDTGVVLNNQLDDFSTPQEVKQWGVIGLGANRPRPNARPVSSMSPAIVLEDGRPILALGGSGGARIATGVTQAALARLVFGLDPSACVSAPRIHVGGPSAEMQLPLEIPEDVRAALRARGEIVKEERYPFAAVNLVAWERRGNGARVLAAADPRKQGFAAAQ
jgi:gamma-glutamyltranspeptidase/glutathione hydrolase